MASELTDVPSLQLDGRTALVTGGARGLGLAIAHVLAQRGARVCLLDLDDSALGSAKEQLRDAGPEIVTIAGDVSDPKTAGDAVADCISRWGRLDILINNAGISGKQVPLWEIADDDWERVMAVNLNSVFYFCKAAVPGMIAQGYGRIVNVASIAGKEGNASSSQYSTSKGGIITLTKSLGKELATSGVLVNAIAPAVIETDIIRGAGITPAVRDSHIAKIPMGRVGQPSEVAALVGFLVSEQLSFSTAAVYDISGGRATY
jgi:NAD(P)-dependent dehydrogenase (short-subunit alcohol dehydrogenase family)